MSRPVLSTFSSSASAQEVHALLVSPEWVQTKAERFRDGALLTEHVVEPDGGVRLTVSRTLPDGVPGALQRFLPSDGRVLETFDWGPAAADGSRSGTWKADIPGAPAQLGGTLRLELTATGSTYTIAGEVKVRVPVVGGKAEAFIAEMVQRLAAKEADLLLAELGAS